MVVGLHPKTDLREVEEAFAHSKSREAEIGATASQGAGNKAAPAPAVALEPQVGATMDATDNHEKAMRYSADKWMHLSILMHWCI